MKSGLFLWISTRFCCAGLGILGLLLENLEAQPIFGEFQAVATGSKGGGDRVKTAFPGHLQALKRQLGGAEPTAMIYFGCAGWRTALTAQQEVLQRELPKELGIYGQFCGGEMGQLEDKPDLVADTDLGVIVLMAPLKFRMP